MKKIYWIYLFIIIIIIIIFIYSNYMKLIKNINAIVFDFDETLGDFGQYHELSDYVSKLEGKKLTMNTHMKLLTTFNKYLRPDLQQIFDLINKNKKRNTKVVLYTNNQGGKQWVNLILYCLSKITNNTISFDKKIYAYKDFHNRIIEEKRTSHSKKYSDFITIMNFPKTTKVLFFDDQIHEQMDHPNVQYYHIKPYRFSYSSEEIFYMLQNIGYNPSLSHIQRDISFDKRYSTIQNGLHSRDKNISSQMKKIIAGFI